MAGYLGVSECKWIDGLSIKYMILCTNLCDDKNIFSGVSHYSIQFAIQTLVVRSIYRTCMTEMPDSNSKHKFLSHIVYSQSPVSSFLNPPHFSPFCPCLCFLHCPVTRNRNICPRCLVAYLAPSNQLLRERCFAMRLQRTTRSNTRPEVLLMFW